MARITLSYIAVRLPSAIPADAASHPGSREQVVPRSSVFSSRGDVPTLYRTAKP